MMNSTGVHGKRSSLERRLDKLIFCIFGLLAVICIIDAVGSSRWVNKVPATMFTQRAACALKPTGRFETRMRA